MGRVSTDFFDVVYNRVFANIFQSKARALNNLESKVSDLESELILYKEKEKKCMDEINLLNDKLKKYKK